MITQKRLKELFDYRDDGQLVWKVKSSRRVSIGDVAGSYTNRNYKRIRIDGANHFAHRLVWLYHNGSMIDLSIDHINGVRDDNRISNLRLATSTQNQRNKKKINFTSSIYKGVTWDNGKWKAQIQINGKSKHLLRTDNELKAYEAYCKAAKEHFGEFARFE